ncbi:hypothetical protein L1049_002304 [Liquidambar formosana]|uniref:FAS1 domain-containing protein n=1 Tax=Liquidambar formosana TaxID=63359 RepID=A0AAP0NEN6_LIQFO
MINSNTHIKYMATHMVTLTLLLMALISISSAAPTDVIPSRSQDLLIAIEEMQTANYFTFVMLINMSPPDLFQGNVTLLMPNDRMLSKNMMAESAVADFLLRHSIPSPLLFENLQLVPTGSIIPSSKPDFMLKVSNNGRRSYFLNNVKIISPNICVAGSSIRCHGIDGVLLPEHNNTITNPLPNCPNSTSPLVGVAAPPASSVPSPLPPIGDLNPTPVMTAPPPTDPDDGPQKSGGSSRWLRYRSRSRVCNRKHDAVNSRVLCIVRYTMKMHVNDAY